MRRWPSMWLTIVALAPAAYAAEPTIELPIIEVVLPAASPPHFQREGLPYPFETELVTDLLGLVGDQKYEEALALVGVEHADTLALLEAGDPDNLITVGPGRLPLSIPVPVATLGTEVSSTVLYLVGHAYLAQERYLAAETAFKAALGPLPDYARPHESLGLLYLQTDRYDEARVHLTRAAELGLNTPGLHAALGYVNTKADNWWGAAISFERALALQHDNRNFKTGLLQALNETRQYVAALALVEQMLQDEPNDPDLWLYRAQMALSSERRDLALTSLETALRLGDDSVANKQVCATLHFERGSIGRAVELLKSAAGEDLDFQFMDQGLAWLTYEGEWDYFRELLEGFDERRASLTGLEQSRLLMRRASLLLHDGDRQAGITSLQEAVELDAANADALMMLGQAYLDDRDYTRAELTFERTSTFESHRDNALVSLAQIAIDQQNFERALTLLRDVVERNPERTDLQRNVDVLENLVLVRTSD